MTNKYYIIESGTYSDYTVSFIDASECKDITHEEIEFCLSIDRWNEATVAGEIHGTLELSDKACLNVRNLKEEINSKVNQTFSCYENRKHKTVLDREYSKEELLKMVNENDGSGLEYWTGIVEEHYASYLKAIDILNRISQNNK